MFSDWLLVRFGNHCFTSHLLSTSPSLSPRNWKSFVRTSLCCLRPPEIWKESSLTPLFPYPPQPFIYRNLVNTGSALPIFSWDRQVPATLLPSSFQFLTWVYTGDCLSLGCPHTRFCWMTQASAWRSLPQWDILWPLPSIFSEAPWTFFHGSYHNFIFILICVSVCLKYIAL